MSFKINSYGFAIYLNDLKEELRKGEIEGIKQTRQDLYKKIIEGHDILIGYAMRVDDYSVV